MNILQPYYSEVTEKFPITAYLIDISLGLECEYEIDWVSKGYSPFPQSIRRCLRVSPTEKLILAEIYTSMGYETHSTITRKALSDLLDIGEDTVRENIKKLEEKKFLNVGEYQGRFYYEPLSLARNPYIVMSELTHYAKQNYKSQLPKKLCDSGVQHRIGQIVKSNKYNDFIEKIKNLPSFDNIIDIRVSYFSYLEETIFNENKVKISIE